MDYYVPEPNSDEIDYMHPDGKPVRDPVDDPLEAKPAWHDIKKAMEETDGHWMPERDPFMREFYR